MPREQEDKLEVRRKYLQRTHLVKDKCPSPVEEVDDGSGAPAWGREYGKSLCLPHNLAVNLKLL